MREFRDTVLDDEQEFAGQQGEVPVSARQQLKGLSGRSNAVIAYLIIVAIFTIASTDWILGLFYVLTHLCVIVPLLRWWWKYSQSCPLEVLVRSFGMGYILIAWGVIIALVLIVVPVATLIGKLSQFLRGIATTCGMVGTEELFKVLVARRTKAGLDMDRETKAHQIAYTATSVGYAVATASLWMLTMGILIEVLLGKSAQPTTGLDFALMSFMLVVILAFSVPLHCLSGYMIGLNTTRKLPFWRIGLQPFLLRSAFMLQIQLWFAILPTFWALAGVALTNAGICYIMVRQIKAVEAELPQEYLVRVGYLQAFGYGVLPGGEAEDVELPSNNRAQLV